MTTFDGLELREIPLGVRWGREARAAFLASQGLRAEEADFAVGIYDAGDNLAATASLSGEVITCVAVSPGHRDSALANTLVSTMLGEAAERGIHSPRVFTKPEYAPLFRSMGFVLLAGSPEAVLLEYGRRNRDSYLAYLRENRTGKGKSGCIIMHCNPLTEGHLHLIRVAARQTDTLYIIPVGDEPDSMFGYKERKCMLMDATASMDGVRVLEGSPYAISRSTFPTYFLKKLSDATDTHIRLDLDIFTSLLAPALGVDVRFAGTEPSDGLTARYNALMREILPASGIDFVEIPRLEREEAAISASNVRNCLNDGNFMEAVKLTPAASWPSMLGYLACRALISEAELTPKPGLVDKADSGSHTDMDLGMMRKSAETLRSVFSEIARLVFTENPDIPALISVGVEGEKRMLEATGGVNTHRGALFSLGLAVASAGHILSGGGELSPENVRAGIRTLAKDFPRAEGTHGASVAERYGIPTALDNARDGYGAVFRLLGESDPHRVLLALMSELEDTNIYHRCGAETAAEVRGIMRESLKHFPSVDWDSLNKDFISRRISPGGSADMLALWYFLKSIFK